MSNIPIKSRRNGYSNYQAVKYAQKYALHPNPSYRYFPLYKNTSGDCANFISQCLFAGGAPMDFSSSNAWWYNNKGTKNVNDDTWSLSWTVAHSLFWTIKIRGQLNSPGLKGIETYNIRDLQIGDLIFYEDYKHIIFHSAIITSFASGMPLVSHHSFEALNIPYKRGDALKPHFIKILI